MSVDRRLLEILVCPVTKVPVKRLAAERLANVNGQISAGEVRNSGGETLAEPINEALVTEDDRTIYVVDDGIPVMLEDQGIPTEQLRDW